MIRPIRVQDVPSIIWCLKELRQESPTYNYVVENEQYVEQNLVRMFDDSNTFGVIDNDEDCKGFMFGVVGQQWYSERLDAYEQLLYVKPQYRGSGLAVKLISAFEKAARECGAVTLTVGASVGIKDDRTEGLYERLGYKWVGKSLVKEL